MRKHLSTEWEVSGASAAYLYFENHNEMHRSLLMEIARGAQYQAQLTNDIKKHHWANGFYTILTILSVLRGEK